MRQPAHLYSMSVHTEDVEFATTDSSHFLSNTRRLMIVSYEKERP
jgi:hypothetical protein